MKTQTIIKIYELNDKEPEGREYPEMIIKSFWNGNESVVIEINGQKAKVIACQLTQAIRNVTNN